MGISEKGSVQNKINLEDLKGRIRTEVIRISLNVVMNVKQELFYRLGVCQEVVGEHFLYLIN